MKIQLKNSKAIRNIVLFSSLFVFASSINAQKNVGIGTLTPDISAILELSSVNQGFLTTRIDSTQMTGIAAPANGLLVYNTTDNCFWYFKSNRWVSFCQDSVNFSTAYVDSLFANIIITDTLVANYAKIDSIFSKYIMTDSLFANFGQFDSLYARFADIDTLLINGVPLDSFITSVVDTTAWVLKGNVGTDASVDFMGTTDKMAVVFKTNNNEVMRLDTNGNVGIGTSTPDPSALLEMNSTTKGLLIPRTDTALVTSPATGLLIYHSNDSAFYYYDGVRWNQVGSGQGGNAAGNIYTVTGSVNDSIGTATWTDIQEMSLTITPTLDTVHASFSASGFATTNVQQRVDFRLVKDATPIGGTTSTTRGYSLFVSQDTVAWNTVVKLPIPVTPGTPTTIKVQWKMQSLNGTGMVRNMVATDPDKTSHRTLRIDE